MDEALAAEQDHAMPMRYHADALTKDVEYRLGYVAGLRNVAAVKAELARLKPPSNVDPQVLRGLDLLEGYFGQLRAGLTEEERAIAERQELGGEYFDDGPEAEALDRAEAREIHTTIDQREAVRLAWLLRSMNERGELPN